MTEEEKLGRANFTPTSRTDNSSNPFSRYAPLIIWAALIFIGSSDLLSSSHTSSFLLRPLHWLFPHASDATLATVHMLIRKAGHFSEYAILALLAARAFRNSPGEILRTRWFWASLALVVVYALSDEYHQSFVSTRTASIHDSLIDSAGGLAALIIVSCSLARTRRKATRMSAAS